MKGKILDVAVIGIFILMLVVGIILEVNSRSPKARLEREQAREKAEVVQHQEIADMVVSRTHFIKYEGIDLCVGYLWDGNGLSVQDLSPHPCEKIPPERLTTGHWLPKP